MSIKYNAPPTIGDFMRSNAFGRILAGPVGSGKTTGCIMEVLRRCMEQEPGEDGLRYTRFAFVRQTLKQLKDTVLRDMDSWLAGLGEWQESKSTYFLKFGNVRSEWLFIPLEEALDQARLLSTQLTGVWINELIESQADIIAPIMGRVGRYPSANRGTPTWHGILADTNMPVEMSEWHRFMTDPPGDWQIFLQPSGLAPNAENLSHLLQTEDTRELPEDDPRRAKAGRRYYERLVEQYGSQDPWIRRYVFAMYGDDPSGEAVFRASFKPSWHVVDETFVSPGSVLLIGQDFGRNPWSLIGSLDASGRLLIHQEVAATNIGLEKHLNESLRPQLYSHRFAGSKAIVVGDPAGVAKSTIAEETSFDALRRLGFAAYPAPSNDPDTRLRAVEALLGRAVNGGPALVINGRGCPWLVRAMSGGYRFKKLKEGALRSVPDKTAKEGFDHVCFTAGTKIATPTGELPIETLRPGDLVCTPLGPRRITATGHRISNTVNCQWSNNVEITCSPDHPFWTNRGWIPASKLTKTDLCCTLSKSPQSVPGQLPRYSNSTTSVGIYRGATTPMARVVGCMSPSTSTTSDPFHRAMTYITRTATRVTTLLKIWSASLKASITGSICSSLRVLSNPGATSGLPLSLLPASAAPIPSGQAKSMRRQGARWRASWPPNQNNRLSAFIAVANTRPIPAAANAASAPHDVKPQPDISLESTTRQDSAASAATVSLPINMQGLDFVRLIARDVRAPARVYNITVDDAHCYYANGMLVSNCDALQYMCLIVHGNLLPTFIRHARFSSQGKAQQWQQPAVRAAGWT
jgi:hypothetical protein